MIVVTVAQDCECAKCPWTVPCKTEFLIACELRRAVPCKTVFSIAYELCRAVPCKTEFLIVCELRWAGQNVHLSFSIWTCHTHFWPTKYLNLKCFRGFD